MWTTAWAWSNSVFDNELNVSTDYTLNQPFTWTKCLLHFVLFNLLPHLVMLVGQEEMLWLYALWQRLEMFSTFSLVVRNGSVSVYSETWTQRGQTNRKCRASCCHHYLNHLPVAVCLFSEFCQLPRTPMEASGKKKKNRKERSKV